MAPVCCDRPRGRAVQTIEEGQVGIEARLVAGPIRRGERKGVLAVAEVAKFDALRARIASRVDRDDVPDLRPPKALESDGLPRHVTMVSEIAAISVAPLNRVTIGANGISTTIASTSRNSTVLVAVPKDSLPVILVRIAAWTSMKNGSLTRPAKTHIPSCSNGVPTTPGTDICEPSPPAPVIGSCSFGRAR